MLCFIFIMPNIMKNLLLLTLSILFPVTNISAWNNECQDTHLHPDPDSIWNRIELTGKRFKEVLGAPPPSQTRTWPYFVIGGTAVGAGVYLITREKEDPSPMLISAVSDQLTALCGSSATVNVLANDSGENLSISAVTQPAQAVVTISGSSLLISNIGSTSFSFSYTIIDAAGQMASAQVNVSVTLPLFAVNDDAYTVASGATLSDNVLLNDVGTLLTVSSNTHPPGGTLMLSPNGQFSFVPVAGFCGSTPFSYTATDQCNQSATALVTLTVPDAQNPTISCPPTASVPCGSSTDPSVTGNPTVSDNCTPTPQITVAFSDQAAGDQIMRTWNATDQVGNTASCVQTINFSDTQPPTISCPPTATVPCGSSTDPSVTGNPTVSDNCTPTPQITVAFSDQAAGDQIMRTWTATDQVGNAASCVQTINFSDTQPPTISCPPTATVPCGSSTAPSATGSLTVSDNCSSPPQITVAFSDQTAGDQILRTWTATDQAGNAASCVQTISYSDNQAPVITCPANAVLPAGTPPTPNNTGNPTASDNCTPTPQIALAFSDQSSGTGCAQVIQRTWTATDLAGNAASCVQTISYSDTQAPVITCPANAVLPAGTPPTPNNTGNPTASDNCTPTPQIALAFSDQSTGTGCAQVIQRTWTATDQAGNAASCVQTISYSDTQAPVITCPANAVLPAGTPPTPNNTGNPTASDNCTPTPQIALAFSDQSTGTGCAQVIQRTWTATDQAGNAASCVQTISYSDTQAPVITCPANAVLPAGTPPTPNNTGNPTASDNCTPTPQIALTFSDQSSGTGCAQVIQRTWTATDLAGNTASCVQTISYSDTQAPVITCPANAVLPAGTPPTPNNTGNPTATDNCTPTPQIALAFSDQSSGTGCAQVIQRTWTATDQAGNAASCVQTISFSDTQAPTITCPAPATRPCGSSLDPSQTGSPTAVDNCTLPPQITFSFADQGGGTGCGQTIMRLWTATDASGNASNCTQQIQVIDLEAPIILCPPNITVSCGQHLDIGITGTPVVNDACGNPVEVVFSDDLSEFNNCEGLITRTWLSVDICGNSSSCQQLIFVTLTLQKPTPSLMLLPIRTHTDVMAENASQQIVVQLPENPNLVLFDRPEYSYGMPIGVSIGISWHPRWQLWGQWQSSSGQINYTLITPSALQPITLSVPFSHTNSRLGLRLSGKSQRLTPFVGVIGEYRQILFQDGTGWSGNRRFSVDTKEQSSNWLVYLETGLQLQAGKNASFEIQIERIPNLLPPAVHSSFANRFGLGYRLFFNKNHNTLLPKAEFWD
jgi:hypothetical protein